MMQSRSLYSNCRGAQFEHELMLGSIIGVLACGQKNKPEGSTLVRKCWCKDCPRTCPVHVVGKLVEKCVPGEALFGGVFEHFAIVFAIGITIRKYHSP